MTKHLCKAEIERNVEKLKIEAREGRSEKAAQLHAIEAKDNAQREWCAIRSSGHADRGGDRWRCRGQHGIWHRSHTTPRASLFTPYRVARGPAKDVPLSVTRFTYGVTKSGKRFEFHDDWTLPQRRHMVLEEPWVGHTIFTERSVNLVDAQRKRLEDSSSCVRFEKLRGKWADAYASVLSQGSSRGP